MLSRKIGLLSIVVAIAVAGVGYASFTSGVTVNGTASAGTLSIQWVGPGSPAVEVSDAAVGCVASLTPSALTIVVVNLFPGAYCTMPASDGVVVENVGSLPATLTGVYVGGAVTGPSSPCGPYSFDIGNAGYSPYLAVGGSFPWFQNVGLDPSAGNGCQGDTFTFTIYFNATVA